MSDCGRIAIVGAAGFLGRHLISSLEGWEVHTLDRAPLPRELASRVRQHFEGDALDPDLLRRLLEGVDLIWFRQGLLGGTPSVEIGLAPEYLRVNAEAVMAGLAACTESGTARVVLDSSEQVFGTSGDLERQKPDTEPTACNYYGASKLVAEKAVSLWAHAAEGRSAQVLRYSRVRSPETRDVLFHMAKACLAGGPIRIVGNPSHRISFVDVHDVIRTNLSILGDVHRAPRFAIHHVSSDRPYSLWELSERIQMHANRRVPVHVERGSGRAFEPHVVGMEWEESAEVLGCWPQSGVDAMILATLAWIRREESQC